MGDAPRMAHEARPFPTLADGLRYGAAGGLTLWCADSVARLAAAVSSRQVPWSAYNLNALALECFLAGLTAGAGMLIGVLAAAVAGKALRRLPASVPEGPIALRARVVPYVALECAALLVLALSVAGRHLSARQFVIAVAVAMGVSFLFTGALLRRRSRVLALSGPLLLVLGLALASLTWLLRVLQTPEILADPRLEVGTARSEAADVLLITMDTTRADRLGCYGNERARTPNLDRLAAEGVLYERAYAPTSSTQPSHASILTGLQMPWHGVRRNNEAGLDESVPTVPALLAQQGYATRAVISAYPLDRQFGFWRGFGYYDDRMPQRFSLGHAPRQFQVYFVRRSVGYRLAQAVGLVDLLSESTEICRTATETADAALAALASAPGDRPLFLWVHWWDPHGPYDPPRRYYEPYPAEPDAPARGYGFRWGRYPSRADVYAHYDGDIAYMDAELGRVLEAFRARGRSHFIAATADHGEGLHEHGVVTHGSDVFDVTLHVPLIVGGAGVPAGVRVQESVAAYDLAPTILQLASAPFPPDLAAAPLQPFDATAPAAQAGRSFYHEATQRLHAGGARDLNRAWRAQGWKYLALVENPAAPAEQELLYRYVEDARETRNLVQEHADLARELLAALEAFTSSFPIGRGVTLRADEERDANMAELGYADGDTPPAEDGPIPP
ncbi:MAG: hypothetical protein EYC70_02020 [Planctomycetota bacterium]|nr:MAG: hypothetical protein EYC70_02020 [Planctomycetota bacterium]